MEMLVNFQHMLQPCFNWFDAQSIWFLVVVIVSLMILLIQLLKFYDSRQQIKEDPLPRPGDQIELVLTNDPYTKLEPGDRGIVNFVDDMKTIHINWDSGDTLGLILGIDKFRILKEGE